MKIEDTKPIWVAWSNTDCTEGRGFRYALVVADSYEAAARLGKGGNVQGSDCEVTEEVAFKIKGKTSWYCPRLIQPENREDRSLREAREKREAVLEKVRAAGITEEDIAILNG